jgi:hypothetical protein
LAALFRYFSSEEYARAFMEDGAVLFRALSYFRDYEDAGVRADPYEGTLAHRPDDGLRLHLVDQKQVVVLQSNFEARACEDDIFVYCLSTELSPHIARRFQAKVAVVVKDRGTFFARVRQALDASKAVRADELVRKVVRYCHLREAPVIDWALPERIALRKPKSFEWQREYRIAVPVGNAFKVENVELAIVEPGRNRPQRREDHPQLMVHVGSLSNICRLHRF